MRYFQKAVKRAGLDIAYSQGFSPHQLMSFAAPLALGVTSEGEYFDAEFNSLIPSDEFVRCLNEQMAEGIVVKDVVLLPEHAKNSMSIVAASDYIITVLAKDSKGKLLDEADGVFETDVMIEKRDRLLEASEHLLEKDIIEVLRKTKKNEKIEDIRKGIFKLHSKGDRLYMLLAAGSEYNLKPELVLEALCRETGYEYKKFDYQVHRIETYMKNKEGELVSLLESGTRFN